MKTGILLLTLSCIIATGIAIYLLGGIEPAQIQALLKSSGIWALIIYIALYVVATMLVLPSTVLNLTGGAIFVPWLGTFWTSIGAVIAAIIAFIFTRTIGHQTIGLLCRRVLTTAARVRIWILPNSPLSAESQSLQG